MKTNPACWFEVYVQPLGRAKQFHETVLGTELTKLDAPLPDIELLAFAMEMEGEGAAGALVKMDGFPSGGNSTLVYFACENCATEASRVESASGKRQKEQVSLVQYSFMALAIDTEGNIFGLHSQKQRITMKMQQRITPFLFYVDRAEGRMEVASTVLHA